MKHVFSSIAVFCLMSGCSDQAKDQVTLTPAVYALFSGSGGAASAGGGGSGKTSAGGGKTSGGGASASGGISPAGGSNSTGGCSCNGGNSSTGGSSSTSTGPICPVACATACADAVAWAWAEAEATACALAVVAVKGCTGCVATVLVDVCAGGYAEAFAIAADHECEIACTDGSFFDWANSSFWGRVQTEAWASILIAAGCS